MIIVFQADKVSSLYRSYNIIFNLSAMFIKSNGSSYTIFLENESNGYYYTSVILTVNKI